MRNLLLSALLILTLSASANAVEKAPALPTMSFTDTTGKTYTVHGTESGLKIDGLEDKIVFLEFFGHMCPPCLASIPHLIKIQEKYKDKLAVIAIEVQGFDTEKLTKFAKEKGMNYISASEETAHTLVSYIQQRAQWRGSIPFFVAMDTKGDVQYVQAGRIPERSMEDLIKKLSPKEAPLAKSAKTVAKQVAKKATEKATQNVAEKATEKVAEKAIIKESLKK